MNALDLSQFLMQAAIAGAAIVGSVAVLFKTMSNSYGAVIGTLQVQNKSQQEQIESQQKQLTELGVKVASAEADCQRRLAAVEKSIQLTITSNGGNGNGGNGIKAG